MFSTFFAAGNCSPILGCQRRRWIGTNELTNNLIEFGDVETNPGPLSPRNETTLSNRFDILSIDATNNQDDIEQFVGFESLSSPERETDAKGIRESLTRFLKEKYPKERPAPKAKEELVIAVWNAGGLKSKIKTLEVWCKENNVDVVMIQEVQQKKPTKMLGFNHPVQVNRTRARLLANKVGSSGGVAIYTREGIRYSKATERPFVQEDDVTEWCGIHVYNNKKKLTLHNVYRPPIRSSTDDDRVDRFGTSKWSGRENEIIAGDLNAHHPMWDGNCDSPDDVGERMVDFCMQANYDAMNDGSATRLHDNNETAPDIVLCHSNLLRHASWELGEDIGSDHLPMLVKIKAGQTKYEKFQRKKFNFRKADWVGYKDACENQFAELRRDNFKSINKLAGEIEHIILSNAKRYIPLGTRKNPMPWLEGNPEIIQLIKERNDMRRKICGPETYKKWVEKRKECAEEIAKAKMEDWKRFCSKLDSNTDPSQVSRVMKHMDEDVSDQGSNQALVVGGKVADTPAAKAEILIKMYAKVSRLQYRKSDKKIVNGVKRFLKKCQFAEDNNMDKDITTKEIEENLYQLKDGKAPGPDYITAEMLKHLGPSGIESIKWLLNWSWNKSTVPSKYRKAKIIPIHKTGKDPTHPASYRPISLTSHVVKLLEKILKDRLYSYVEANNLLPENQNAFRQGMSTEDNLARIIQYTQDNWEKPLPRKKLPGQEDKAAKTALLAFDFSKAYDKVWKMGLLHKMIQMNIPVKMIKWVRAFIWERYAQVDVEGKTSKWKKMKDGLPQGSVMAPLLFIIFLADLDEALSELPRTDPNFFADDTSVAVQGTTIQEVTERAQTAADKFSGWARKWKMQIAPEKTQMLILSQNSADATAVEIKINGTEVKAADKLKILGVTLDRKLQFGKHVKELKNKVLRRCRQLSQVASRSWGANTDTRKTIVKSYIDGAALYGIGAWGPATAKTHVQNLEKTRKMAARLQTGCLKSTPDDALYSEAHMLPLESHIKTKATKIYEKAKRLKADHPLGSLTNKDRGRERSLKTVCGWRKIGEKVSKEAGLDKCKREEIVKETIRTNPDSIKFNTDLITDKTLPPETRREIAEKYINERVPPGARIYSDGSAVSGVADGGAGALLIIPNGVTIDKKAAAGQICSSTRAELQAILLGLEEAVKLNEQSVSILLDSRAAIMALQRGPTKQKSEIGRKIWKAAEAIGTVNMFWIPSHCGIEGNEAADILAKEGSKLDQRSIPIPLESAMNKISSKIENDFLNNKRKKNTRNEPDPHWQIFGNKWPGKPKCREVQQEIAARQIRTGHSSLLKFHAHRIGILPTQSCQSCTSLGCPAVRCDVCGSGADTAYHAVFECGRWTAMREKTPEERLEVIVQERLGHAPQASWRP